MMTTMTKVKENIFLDGVLILLSIYLMLRFFGLTKIGDRRKGIHG
jgi:hypothetical protein